MTAPGPREVLAAVALLVVSSLPAPAAAQGPGGLLERVRTLASEGIDAARAQQGVLRGRLDQLRVRNAGRPGSLSSNVPLLANNLNITSDQGTSFELRDALPEGLTNGLRARGQTQETLRGYVGGDLHADLGPAGSGYAFDALTGGADLNLRADLVSGLAASHRLSPRSTGTALAAYASLMPAELLNIDMTLSVGQTRLRHDEWTGFQPATTTTQAFSVSVASRSEHRDWRLTPYGRFESIASDVGEGRGHAGLHERVQTWSLGGNLSTQWMWDGRPVEPRISLQLLHESISTAPSVSPSRNLTAWVDFQVKRRIGRYLTAWAETRFRRDRIGARHAASIGVRYEF